MLRKALVAAGVLAVIAFVAGLLALRNFDSIVRSAIEDVGGQATGAAVSVDHVHIEVSEGNGTIRGLVVGNPAGFETPHAFAFGTIYIEMEPQALLERPVIVRSVKIEGCDVSYEWSTGGSNIARIEENVAAFIADLAPAGSASDDGAAKIVIERLVIEGGHIDVSATFLGSQQVGAPLRRIVLENVGTTQGGLTSGEIAAIVLAELTGGVLEAVAGLGIDGLNEIRKLGEGVLDAAGSLLEGIIGR